MKVCPLMKKLAMAAIATMLVLTGLLASPASANVIAVGVFHESFPHYDRVLVSQSFTADSNATQFNITLYGCGGHILARMGGSGDSATTYRYSINADWRAVGPNGYVRVWFANRRAVAYHVGRTNFHCAGTYGMTYASLNP